MENKLDTTNNTVSENPLIIIEPNHPPSIEVRDADSTLTQRDPGNVETADSSNETASLFERMGGKEAIDKAVTIFYGKVMMDSRVNSFFEGVDLFMQMGKMKAFMSFAFGGAPQYDGETLEKAHQPLVEKGLNDSHFNAVMENLGATLKELEVPDALIGEAASIVESVRSSVLGKNSEENKPIVEAEVPAIEKRKNDPKVDEAFLSKNDNRRGIADTSIRVDVNLLDKLMNLVGELVLARNQVLQFSGSGHDAVFAATSQHLNLVTTELQEGVMKTRMQPIGNIWGKFPRVVRDLSMSCGKKVRLEMEGKETELDKTLIESIKDPLTHIVRNSVDHGIETPDVRIAAGKNEEGVLKLRAFHEGGQVNIEIIDDGNGMNPEKLKAKAIEKNLITQEQASKMSNHELVNLVFLPGFSTAAKVTNVSGRGVGMDVVKTNIEKIGGTVDINSQMGQGTTLKVKIPLTLAIIPALIVTCNEDRFAIPQVNLLELLRLDGAEAMKGVEEIQGSPVYRLRGNLLPLLYLDQQLNVKTSRTDEAINIVVLHVDNQQFGLVVDMISDTEEIVVKPLGKQLKEISAFAGTTIMGDGKVALILDVMGLAQNAHALNTHRSQVITDTTTSGQPNGSNGQTLLILKVDGGRMAIPLSTVARLEEFNRSDVEQSGNNDVVQYREEIMPLVYLANYFNGEGSHVKSEAMQAVVYTYEGKSVGLVVDQILDIVEETITVKRSLTRKGILGTVVVKDQVTELIDVEAIVKVTEPKTFDEKLLPAGLKKTLLKD
jgi:two-component system, chemotaxis family, sensor kinase CheA